MPHDMFADAVVRPISPRARRRRRLLAVLSVVLHIVVIVPIAIGQVLAVGALPIPRQPVIFDLANVIHAIDVPMPPPPAPRRAAESPIANPSNAAPIVAPDGVTPEPDHPVVVNQQPDGIPGVEPGVRTDLFGPVAIP